MKILKKLKSHLIIVIILILAAALMEGIVYFHLDELRMHPITLNRFLTIYPTYNENGSWIHGRLEIGYIRWLLILEGIVDLLILFFFFRFMKVFIRFFHMNTLWLHIIDFGFADTVYRLITNIRGTYVLDYLKLGKYVYDFIDLYIGITITGCLIWFIAFLIKYYIYRSAKVKGLSFIKKQIWELKVTGILLKAVFIQEKRWDEEFKRIEMLNSQSSIAIGR